MINAERISVSRERPDIRALTLVPENVARRICVMPLRVNEGGRLAVAAPDTADALIFDELRVLTGFDVEIFLDSQAEIIAAISRHYKIASSVRDAMSDSVALRVARPGGPGGFIVGEERSPAPDAPPIVRLFDDIIGQAVDERASDVHVEPLEDCTIIRFRVDGKLYESLRIARALHPALTTRIKITSGMDIAEKRKPQDGRALITLGGRKIDARVSSIPSIFGEKIVLRLLDQNRNDIAMEKLGFEREQSARLMTAVNMGSGMFLITGPTGSGKSTTLYSLLDKMNRPELNIITIEDPVEYTIRGITQIQINEKSGVTFPSVLRSVLR